MHALRRVLTRGVVWGRHAVLLDDPFVKEKDERATVGHCDGARAEALACGHGLATTASIRPALRVFSPVLPPFPTHARARTHTHSPYTNATHSRTHELMNS
eukprot:638324-Rhodomonas_salina.1